MTIRGAGITNNSGVTQNFVSTVSSEPIKFIHSATAGSETTFTNSNGYIEFRDTANPGTATFVTSNGGNTIFFDQAKSDNATFITNSGGTTFPNFHNGANGTCISKPGGTTYLGDGDRAGNATLIANGGVILFDAFSTGDTARVELFNGLLYTADSYHLTLGSIEGDGVIELGDGGLEVGSNNLSTVFSEQIRDDNSEERGATLVKGGSGTLTLSSRNFYKNGTVVLDGTLVLASDLDSAMGHGSVVVQGGTLSGTGGIAGSLKVGTGSGSGAILDPGNGTIPGTLTLQNHLILNGDASYNVLINSNTPASDQVTTKGIVIRSASVLFQDVGTALLPPGTTFTVINNIAATPITGTFSNLADGAIITIGSNTFQASYEGGDGNDLTLTVVP